MCWMSVSVSGRVEWYMPNAAVLAGSVLGRESQCRWTKTNDTAICAGLVHVLRECKYLRPAIRPAASTTRLLPAP